jgi:hypothetical protein
MLNKAPPCVDVYIRTDKYFHRDFNVEKEKQTIQRKLVHKKGQ